MPGKRKTRNAAAKAAAQIEEEPKRRRANLSRRVSANSDASSVSDRLTPRRTRGDNKASGDSAETNTRTRRGPASGRRAKRAGAGKAKDEDGDDSEIEDGDNNEETTDANKEKKKENNDDENTEDEQDKDEDTGSKDSGSEDSDEKDAKKEPVMEGNSDGKVVQANESATEKSKASEASSPSKSSTTAAKKKSFVIRSHNESLGTEEDIIESDANETSAASSTTPISKRADTKSSTATPVTESGEKRQRRKNIKKELILESFREVVKYMQKNGHFPDSDSCDELLSIAHGKYCNLMGVKDDSPIPQKAFIKMMRSTRREMAEPNRPKVDKTRLTKAKLLKHETTEKIWAQVRIMDGLLSGSKIPSPVRGYKRREKSPSKRVSMENTPHAPHAKNASDSNSSLPLKKAAKSAVRIAAKPVPIRAGHSASLTPYGKDSIGIPISSRAGSMVKGRGASSRSNATGPAKKGSASALLDSISNEGTNPNVPGVSPFEASISPANPLMVSLPTEPSMETLVVLQTNMLQVQQQILTNLQTLVGLEHRKQFGLTQREQMEIFQRSGKGSDSAGSGNNMED